MGCSRKGWWEGSLSLTPSVEPLVQSREFGYLPIHRLLRLAAFSHTKPTFTKKDWEMNKLKIEVIQYKKSNRWAQGKTITSVCRMMNTLEWDVGGKSSSSWAKQCLGQGKALYSHSTFLRDIEKTLRKLKKRDGVVLGSVVMVSTLYRNSNATKWDNEPWGCVGHIVLFLQCIIV